MYSIHPGATKMYRDLKQYYQWCRMKIVEFVFWCLNFQQVKVRALESWWCYSKDAHSQVEVGANCYGFCGMISKHLGQVRCYLGHCGQIEQVSHFIPVLTTHNSEKLAKIYICEIVRLYGNSYFYHFRPKDSVYIAFLEVNAEKVGYQSGAQHNLSHVDCQTIQADYSGPRGHVVSLCDSLWRSMGSVSTFDRVFL